VLYALPPLLLLALALSLGPRLAAVPLFEAAFRAVPGWSFIRQPAKFQVLAHLALAILAAAGAGTVARGTRHPRSAAVLAIALGLGAAAEYHPGRPAGLSILPTAGAAFDTIRAVGPRALYVPLWPGDSSYSALYLYATTLTRVPMVNGYSAFIDRGYVSDVYGALEGVNVGAVEAAEHAVLRRLGVRQIVVDASAFPLKVSPFGPALTLAGLRRSPALEPVEGEGPLWVFRVRERPEGPARPPPTSPLGIYWEAESLRRETGRVEPDPRASNGRVVAGQAGRDAAGFFAFGPYRVLPPGAYRATFLLRGRGSLVQAQVTAGRGTRVLGSREALLGDPETFGEVIVPFALEAAAAVEYRVRWDGRGTAAFDAVAVAFAAEPEPAAAIEVEALGHELVERADPAASGGRAVVADRFAPRDRVWSGPLRRYPAGKHRLWVRLKAERPLAGPLAWCGAQASSLGPIRGGRELTAADVPEAGRYVEVPVDFTLERPEVLEFPCEYRGTTEVWFDRLRIAGPLEPGR
jgi:hypothetical protein